MVLSLGVLGSGDQVIGDIRQLVVGPVGEVADHVAVRFGPVFARIAGSALSVGGLALSIDCRASSGGSTPGAIFVHAVRYLTRSGDHFRVRRVTDVKKSGVVVLSIATARGWLVVVLEPVGPHE